MTLDVQTSEDETNAITDAASLEGVESEELSTRIVLAVAATADRDPMDLPPLNDVVNTVALNSLFDASNDEQKSAEMVVSIPYAGYNVTITGGDIHVEAIGESVDSVDISRD